MIIVTLSISRRVSGLLLLVIRLEFVAVMASDPRKHPASTGCVYCTIRILFTPFGVALGNKILNLRAQTQWSIYMFVHFCFSQSIYRSASFSWCALRFLLVLHGEPASSATPAPLHQEAYNQKFQEIMNLLVPKSRKAWFGNPQRSYMKNQTRKHANQKQKQL